MSNEIPYFKIQHAFLSTWTLKQAAHLLLGHDPDGTEFEINQDATNEVSNLYYWLKEKAHKGAVSAQVRSLPLGKNKKPWRYSPDQFFKLLEENQRKYSEDIYKIRSITTGALTGNIKGAVNRVLYRRAAGLIWKQNPKATILQISKELKILPHKLKDKYPLVELTELEPHQIKEYLKKMSPNKRGAPKEGDKPILTVNWPKALESL